MLNKDIIEVTSDVMPDRVEKLGDDSYYYNFNITSGVIPYTDMEGNTTDRTIYKYMQVHLRGIPNYKDCVKAAIREYVTVEEEFDLINSYNKGKNTDEYQEYLTLLESIKNDAKQVFSNI